MFVNKLYLLINKNIETYEYTPMGRTDEKRLCIRS